MKSVPTISVRVGKLLGQVAVLTKEFEGYPIGSTATIEEFVLTSEGSFFRIHFHDIPASLENVEIPELFGMVEFPQPSVGVKQAIRSCLRMSEFDATGVAYNVKSDLLA